MRSTKIAAIVAAFALIPSLTIANPKADLVRGKAVADQLCISCHGADGNSAIPANPSLAGQSVAYLVQQLRDFKSGTRANGQAAVMRGMASQLSDADMLNVAAYFSSQPAKPRNGSNKDLVAAGKLIYRGGIAAKGVPACMGCHGPTGAGIPNQYPRLGAQHAAYVEAQLKAFRNGERHSANAGNSKMMTDIAARLSDAEIKAVSEYIQSLRKP